MSRTCWRDYISYLVWECPGIPQEDLESVARERDVWNTLVSRLPSRSRIEDGWWDGMSTPSPTTDMKPSCTGDFSLRV